MEFTKHKGLAYLPAVVYTEGLLPLLSVNEVLRLRRVCKPLKSICDDHLRRKCPSKSIVRLRDKKKRGEDGRFINRSVKKFVEFDSTSSIRIPSQHFNLDSGIILDPLSLNLWPRYGAQMKHLSMDQIELPFVSNSSQFHFFENLPNLSSLTVWSIDIHKRNDADDADREIVPESLPTCFKKSVRKFAVSYLSVDRESDADKFWETVGLFEMLEWFQFPRFSTRGSPAPPFKKVFQNCSKLIERESSNIKCFDLQNLDHTDKPSRKSLKSFVEQSLRNQIKWENVPAWILEEPLYKTAWMPHAEDLIVSMSNFHSQNAEGLSFPNLLSLDVSSISFGLPNKGRVRDWSKIPQILCPSIYPALRILEVTRVSTEDNKYFSKAWQYLTNLEEVSFQLILTGMSLSSAAFLGYKNETGEPPFLRLIRLKKLSFHIPRTEENLRGYRRQYCKIGDAFHEAFRLMPLKEFKITSNLPITSGTFDTDAVLALCSPGPFIENIEKFSFRNWSMKGVTRNEFRQLAAMFPNNQTL